MNWYKFAQTIISTEDPTEANIGTPNVNVRPYEPIVVQAINELKAEQPGIFDQITDVNLDIGYGQFGSVISTSPTAINLNLNRLKDEVSNQLGERFRPSDPRHEEALKRAIKEIIIHERSHILDFDPETGTFPGGEIPAERAQQEWVESTNPS